MAKLIKKVHIPIYDHRIDVYEGLPEDSIPALCGKVKYYPDMAYCELYLPPKPPGSVFVHELTHISDFVLSNCNINADSSAGGSECRAYLTAWLYRKLRPIIYSDIDKRTN